MGSVISYIECPNCGGEAVEDYYYKTDEFYKTCQACGYTHQRFMTRTGSWDVERDENGNPIWIEVLIEKPFCAYDIEFTDTPMHLCGGIETAEEYNQFITQPFDNDNVEQVTISQFIDGKIEKKYLQIF